MPKPLPESREEQFAKAKSDALKLLSFRARTSKELSRRLREKGYDEALAGEVVEVFKRQRLVDDSAFAEEFVRSRGNQGAAGRRRLERDLKMKGIETALISQALEKFGPEEEASQALELGTRRLAAWKDLPQTKQRQRLYGFLGRRGFSNDAITAAFRKLFSTHLNLD